MDSDSHFNNDLGRVRCVGVQVVEEPGQRDRHHVGSRPQATNLREKNLSQFCAEERESFIKIISTTVRSTDPRRRIFPTCLLVLYSAAHREDGQALSSLNVPQPVAEMGSFTQERKTLVTKIVSLDR